MPTTQSTTVIAFITDITERVRLVAEIKAHAETQDQNGVTLTTFNGPVTISISTRPTGGQVTLLGPTTVNAVSGVATFPGLVIDTAGVGYKLRATINSGTISSPESLPFNVVAAPAT